ncbi:MAG: hypothetical protein JWM65_318 [Sphingomonas bacterium]|nr:hypothetical protein [Sphingomonas bacterium]
MPAALLLAALLAAQPPGHAVADPTASSGVVSVPVDGNVGKPIVIRQAKAGDRFEMELIRGEVKVERSSTRRIEMEVLGPGNDDLARIAFRISWDGDRTSVIDIFPQRYGAWQDECLPPPDARGDFWRVHSRPRIVLHVPAGVVVDVRVREGKVVGI